MIPGFNILGMALSVISPPGLQWRRCAGRATNGAGYTVTSYADPVAIQGSAQPVARSMYERLGLDFGKDYINVYTTAGVVSVGRDESGDVILFNGAAWKCESETDWTSQDGWKQITAVRVPTP